MESMAMQLYQKRLQNLPLIIEELFKVVETDQSLKYMKDESLTKYRTDRILQIVSEILNSEKQKMLIRILEQYEEMLKKIQQTELMQKSENQFSPIKSMMNKKQEEKEVQVEILLKELAKKEKEIKEKQSKINEMQKKLEMEKSCSKCLNLAKLVEEGNIRIEEEKRLMEKTRKDGFEISEELNKQINELKRHEKELQQKNAELEFQLNHCKEEKSIPIKENNEKKERIDNLNKNVRFLEEQLMYVERSFSIIKERVLFGILCQIKGLKKSYSSFKMEISQEMSRMQNALDGLVKENMAAVNDKLFNERQFAEKIEKLNKELNSFIQQEILS